MEGIRFESPVFPSMLGSSSVQGCFLHLINMRKAGFVLLEVLMLTVPAAAQEISAHANLVPVPTLVLDEDGKRLSFSAIAIGHEEKKERWRFRSTLKRKLSINRNYRQDLRPDSQSQDARFSTRASPYQRFCKPQRLKPWSNMAGKRLFVRCVM